MLLEFVMGAEYTDFWHLKARPLHISALKGVSKSLMEFLGLLFLLIKVIRPEFDR